jgi:hypothetical protein
MSVFLYLKFGDCIKPVEGRRFALKKNGRLNPPTKQPT